MLLGTYQPLFRAGCDAGLKRSVYDIAEQTNGEMAVPFEAFGAGWDDPGPMGADNRKYIGFDPLFCFPCRTPEEAFVQSCLASPNASDLFFLIEADEYVKTDRARWEGHIRSGTSYPAQLAGCVSPDLDDAICDFLVPVGKLKEFKLACMALPAYVNAYVSRLGLYFSRPGRDVFIDFDDVEKQLPGFRDRVARADAEISRIRRGRLSAPDCADHGDAETERLLAAKLYKNWFECSVLPALAAICLGGSDHIEAADFFRAAPGIDTVAKANLELARWAEGDRSREGYLAVMDMFRGAWCGSKDVMVAWFNGGPWPGRNEPCLCGSGRKFKKCCGRKYGIC